MEARKCDQELEGARLRPVAALEDTAGLPDGSEAAILHSVSDPLRLATEPVLTVSRD